MAFIEDVRANDVASSEHQNRLIAEVNRHTSEIQYASGVIDSVASEVETLKSKGVAGQYYGSWTDNNGGPGMVITAPDKNSPGYLGMKLVNIDTPVGDPVGCSLSAGTVTVHNAGLWMFHLSAQTIGEGNNRGTRAIFLRVSDKDVATDGASYGLNAAGEASTAISTSTVIRLSAGDKVSPYFAIWTVDGGTTIWRSRGNNLIATWIGA